MVLGNRANRSGDFGTEVSRNLNASQINPSGTSGSYELEGVGGLRRFGIFLTVTPSTDYTLSFYAKNIDATLLKALFTNSSVTTYTYTSEVNTITRLQNMGTPDYLITAACSLIIAQRLARKTCTDCRVPDEKRPQDCFIIYWF